MTVSVLNMEPSRQKPRGARYRIWMAAALLTVLPFLIVGYAVFMRGDGTLYSLMGQPVLVMIAAASMACGYFIMSQHSRNMFRLRKYLEDIVSGKLPDKIVLLEDMDDAKAIQESMNLIVDRLGNRVDRMEEDLSKVEWLLSRRVTPSAWKDGRAYSRRQEWTRSSGKAQPGLILRSVGEETLVDIVGDLIDLLETETMVYEADGSVALQLVASDWCRFLGGRSAERAGSGNGAAAGNATEETVSACLKSGQPVEAESSSGLRLYCAPINSAGGVIGALAFSHGAPPQDEEKLAGIARLFDVDIRVIRTKASAYEPRPAFVVSLAKNKVMAAANLIGEVIVRKKTEDELRHHKDNLEGLMEERTAELKRANERLLREVEERRKAEGLKDTFVETVSHELRTPLAIAREGISLLVDGIPGEINERQRSVLSTSRRSIDRLSNIINELLDIGKIEAGRMRLDVKKTDFGEIVREAVSSLKPLARKKGLCLEEELPPEELEAHLDSGRIMQVLTNLVGNAIKFTERGGVTVAAKRVDGGIECSVSDTGRGIGKEDLSRVFEKFVQVGRAHGAGEKGTGLGLSIARSIVELHGGEIRVNSEINRGSCFTFNIPSNSLQRMLHSRIDNKIREVRSRSSELRLLLCRVEYDESAQPDRVEAARWKGLRAVADSQSFLRKSDFVEVRDDGDVVFVGELDGVNAPKVYRRWSDYLDKCVKDAAPDIAFRIASGAAAFPADGGYAENLLAVAASRLAGNGALEPARVSGEEEGG
jgi:signal transduction histidine kinase